MCVSIVGWAEERVWWTERIQGYVQYDGCQAGGFLFSLLVPGAGWEAAHTDLTAAKRAVNSTDAAAPAILYFILLLPIFYLPIFHLTVRNIGSFLSWFG